tara:strand:- start:3198 stop:3869 length:672 start_codon:yes stop_codon:yes gene_type:complete
MMKQNWKAQVPKDNTRWPFIVVDNWYLPNEEENVWKELDYYITQKQIGTIKRAETTTVARDDSGKARGESFRFYLEEIYHNRDYSPIIKYSYKFRTDEFKNLISYCPPYSRSYFSTNFDTAFVSYYEESDYYKPHHDTFAWTALIWMAREPISFTGGDLIFPEFNTEIKFKNNRLVMFPSCYLHAVPSVKFKQQPKKDGMGRFTLTHFFGGMPEHWLPKENSN